MAISDDTDFASAMLFDELMKALLHIECADKVVQNKYTDPLTIPEPMKQIKGQTKIFQVQLGKQAKQSYQNSASIVVNRVFNLPESTTAPLALQPNTPTSKPTKRDVLDSPNSHQML
ncbi:hypothetical protein L1987_42562 [Smallanthus sonchifolius]|uniref:Uncharacterized protein n=1 Tax=Smallanthus sonchifolius TaxID=185202 RepID=A0ACB9GIZ0_9ASTR|nr:hypothetical protein L1987_42562 [Smallanthus sonchifolius]